MELSTRRWGPRHRRKPSDLLDKYSIEVGGLDHHPFRHEDENWAWQACCRMWKLYHTPGVPGGSLHSSFIFQQCGDELVESLVQKCVCCLLSRNVGTGRPCAMSCLFVFVLSNAASAMSRDSRPWYFPCLNAVPYRMKCPKQPTHMPSYTRAAISWKRVTSWANASRHVICSRNRYPRLFASHNLLIAP